MGDMAAFSKVVIRFQDMVLGYAFSRLGDFHLAEDVAQESFIEAFCQLKKLRNINAFPGWMRFIVKKQCNRVSRRRKFSVIPLDYAGDVCNQEKNPLSTVEDNEERQKVLEAIRNLPRRHRDVTALYYIDGYSQEEISKFLRVRLSTVKKRLYDSRKKLKKRLKTEDYMIAERTIIDLFQRHLSPSLMDKLLEDPTMVELRGEKRELTVLFSDIKGFTSLIEQLQPKNLVSLVNEYYQAMTEIILSNDGMMNAYVGDEIMALWGSPIYFKDHAKKTCCAAIEMQEELERLRRKWSIEGIPPIHAGMGINTGEAVVGNFGTAENIQYTPMGKYINLGNRLQNLTREYGVKIIISEFTRNHVKDDMVTRELDTIAIHGDTVTIYELIARNDHVLKEDLRETLQYYDQAVQAYKKEAWAESMRLFQKSLEASGGRDKPSTVYIDRCQKRLDSDSVSKSNRPT